MLKIILLIVAIFAILFLLLRFVIIPSQSKLPNTIKTPTSEQANHTLSPCPDKPNCVSSTATKTSQKIEAFSFEGSAEEAIEQLKAITTSLPNSRIVTQQANYLHVEFKSPLMAFVDDTEFLVDEATNLIHVRSAARLGYSDLEKNRERIELVRQKFK